MLSRLFGRSKAPAAPGAMMPEGVRAYAIGDVHGCDAQLERLLALIDADDAARPAARTYLIFLGDLVDRGPSSAGVVERVRQRMIERADTRLIMGNHEEVMLLALSGNLQSMRLFLQIGGRETLLSYGLSDEDCDEGTLQSLVERARARVPAEHISMIARGESMVVLGDYAFVHAGVRPRVPLDKQTVNDLRWIRAGFLDDNTRHPKYIVHGHSITEQVDRRENRLGIDTGAFRSGRLTAAGFEAGESWIIEATA